MKLLLDENLSPRLAEFLEAVFPEMAHTEKLLYRRAPDRVIWAFAKEHGFTVVIKDADFHERTKAAPDGCKVIWTRLGNCNTREVSALIRANQEAIAAFCQNEMERCLSLGMAKR